MNCVIKNLIKTLCEDGHDAMVEKRKANHLPIEDVSPYEIIYDSIIKEFERVEKENAKLRECIEKLAKKLRCPTEDGKPKKGIWCGNCREICDADGTNWCDRNTYYPIIEAALKGGNHAND